MQSHQEHSPYTGCPSSAHSTCSVSSNCFGVIVSTEHQGCHLQPSGDGPRMKDNHGSHYGQHFVRHHATSWSMVAANKIVKQDTSVQLPTFQVLPYATVEETAMQSSLMTAFESFTRLCVSCCSFISVPIMNLLSCQNAGLRLLNG